MNWTNTPQHGYAASKGKTREALGATPTVTSANAAGPGRVDRCTSERARAENVAWSLFSRDLRISGQGAS